MLNLIFKVHGTVPSSNRSTFHKSTRNFSYSFINKKCNFPAVKARFTSLCLCWPEWFRKFPEIFSDNFLSHGQIVPNEFMARCYLRKVQIIGCKQVLFFEKFRKVPQGNLLRRKILLKMFLISLTNFRNFFWPEE